MREFPKNAPVNNFLTIQPIFTSSIPIDSATQAGTKLKHRKTQNFILGEPREIFMKKYPQQ
jgi:hypothetical protein